MSKFPYKIFIDDANCYMALIDNSTGEVLVEDSTLDIRDVFDALGIDYCVECADDFGEEV